MCVPRLFCSVLKHASRLSYFLFDENVCVMKAAMMNHQNEYHLCVSDMTGVRVCVYRQVGETNLFD